jgi:diguanylate cyclase (GGDEF)-like protein
VQAPEPFRSLTITDRIYLVYRIGMASVIALIFALGILEFPSEPGVSSLFVFTCGIVILMVGGVFALFARLVLRQETETVMWEMLPVDLFASSALIWSTGGYPDPFYPWMLGLAISYATALRERSAWVISGLACAAYLGAHYFGHPMTQQSLGDFALLVFKAGGLVFTGWVVSDAMHRQRDRESQLSKSQGDVENLNEQLSRRLAELHAISEITEVIHSTLDFDRVGPLVLDILSKVIDLPSSCLFVIDKDKDETLFSASAGLTDAVARSYGDRLALDASGGVSAGDETFSCTTVLDHKRLMVVFCAPSERLERLSGEDRLVLQAVASELVVAVENSQLYKLTKRLSITDELTGLNNYRFLLQKLDEEIERAKRYTRSLSLLMIDADDFKQFNDTYGHIAGDQALADVGAALRSAVREIDVVCRYGGEEFAVVLPETDAEGAFVVAEKVREAVSSHSFSDGKGGRGVRVTVSIGLATFPSAAADREELLRQADDALYQAKHLGRDRVRAPRSGVIHVAVEGSAVGDAPLGGA